MTKKQKIEHKKANQKRRLILLAKYQNVKPAAQGWIAKPGFIQKGKYAEA